MPNGRAVAETLQIGDVVGEVAITITEAMVDAYAASVIAEANMFKTAFEGLKLAVVGFLVSYVFIYNPDLLGLGGPWAALQALATGCLGALLLASGVSGY